MFEFKFNCELLNVISELSYMIVLGLFVKPELIRD